MIDADAKTLRVTTRLLEIQDFVRVVSGRLSIPLFLVFWLADLIYIPQYKWQCLGLRVFVCALCTIANALIQKTKTLLSAQLVGASFTLANSAPITAMIFMSGGLSSLYYAGLTLVTCGIIPFIPWTGPFLVFNLALIYVPFYALGLLLYWNKSQLAGLTIQTFFGVGTVTATLVIRYFTEKLREKELRSNLLLQRELISREKVIKEKTAEGLRLGTLAKQFSPQVVHSIQSGQLDILNSIHRAKICAIFIDIVNSTDRVLKLENEAVNKVISMFMEDTMKVLLKYDITIDKFMGDGVLGFSNDPVMRRDYLERVVDAALEIRERIAKREDVYATYWGHRLDVRIGIALGFANIGFYGSDEYFRTYTAIGGVVNLAVRACGTADVNQILVTQGIAAELGDAVYQFKEVESRTLKGFEGERQNLFEVVTSRKSEAFPADITVCPEGHGILHLDTNKEGIYVFMCRTCGFTLEDGRNTPEVKKAA